MKARPLFKSFKFFLFLSMAPLFFLTEARAWSNSFHSSGPAFGVNRFEDDHSLENELEFLVYRAPRRLDWSSPGSLTRSMFWNSWFKIGDLYYPHGISHLNIKLKCGSDRPQYMGMAGTNPTFDYLKDFIINGSSLDVLLRSTSGKFYEEKEILSWLPVLSEIDFVRSIRFVLSPFQCEKLQKYVEEFTEHGMNQIYGGLLADPLNGEGGGCSAFGMSFLRVLGLPEDDFRDWRREVNLPIDLIATETKSVQKGFLSFLTYEDGSWAKNSDSFLKIRFWDPQLIFDWIDTVHSDELQAQGLFKNYKSQKQLRKIVYLDLRSHDDRRPKIPWKIESKELLSLKVEKTLNELNSPLKDDFLKR